MKFRKGGGGARSALARGLWPGSCLGASGVVDPGSGGNSSGTTLKVLTADGQLLRFPELWTMTAGDLLAHTSHPHHLVCEGNPKDFVFHQSRLTNLKLSSGLDVDDGSFDTDSCTSDDRSDTNSFTASPARRSFNSSFRDASRQQQQQQWSRNSSGGSTSSSSSFMSALSSPIMRRFLGHSKSERKDVLGGILASPMQRLLTFGRFSSPKPSSTRSSPSPRLGSGRYGGGMSPLHIPRGGGRGGGGDGQSDMESDYGSEDGSIDFQLPRADRGRILPLDAELESGRVYYLVPLPRLLPDSVTDSDPNLAWGPSYPACKCCCLKAAAAKRHLQGESKKSAKGNRPSICGSLRCTKSHGLIVMGCTNRSSKINPQDSGWDSDYSQEMKKGSSSISHSGDLRRQDSMNRYNFPDSARSSFSSSGHHLGLSLGLGRYYELTAYRTEEELLRDEMAAKVARAQYRIPPAYCFRNAWKLELPSIVEGVAAVHLDRDRGRMGRSSRSSKDARKADSPKGGMHSPDPSSPFPFPFPFSPSSMRSPGGLRASPRQSHSPGRRMRKSPIYHQQSAGSPHSPSMGNVVSPIRYGRTPGTPSSSGSNARLLDRQLSDSPLHLPATSPDRFHTMPPKFQLNSPEQRSPAAAAAASIRYGGHAKNPSLPPHFQLGAASAPEVVSSYRHNNLNPPSYRQTHPAYSTYTSGRQQHAQDAFRQSEPNSSRQQQTQDAFRQSEPYSSRHMQTQDAFRQSEPYSSRHMQTPLQTQAPMMDYGSDPMSYQAAALAAAVAGQGGSSSSSYASSAPRIVQPWDSPPSGVNFYVGGKTWQICSPQRPDPNYSPRGGGRLSSPGAPQPSREVYQRPDRDVFTPSSPSWPNPSPRPTSTSRELPNSGMLQHGSHGRFRSSPAWRDVRQISSRRPAMPGMPGIPIGWGGPGHNGMHRSNPPSYASYGSSW